MRFRSELLQPPSDDSEATLTRIYDVYRTPEGSIEGEGHANIRKGVCSNEVPKKTGWKIANPSA